MSSVVKKKKKKKYIYIQQMKDQNEVPKQMMVLWRGPQLYCWQELLRISCLQREDDVIELQIKKVLLQNMTNDIFKRTLSSGYFSWSQADGSELPLHPSKQSTSAFKFGKSQMARVIVKQLD